MTTLALAVRSPRTRAIGVVIVAIALALSAQIALPLPGTPVPLSLQPFVVVIAGLLIGPIDAAAAMVLYLAAGAVGAPVFAPMGAPGIARLLLTLLMEMRRRNLKRGLASLCVGGGQGAAFVLERD